MELQGSASFAEQGGGEGGVQGGGCLYAGLSPGAHPPIIMQQMLGSWMQKYSNSRPFPFLPSNYQKWEKNVKENQGVLLKMIHLRKLEH